MKNLVIILALLGFNVCTGQPVTIRGRILNEQRRPISFANVALFRASDTLTVVSGTASDLDGRYAVEAPAPGEYRLRVSYLGYRSVSLAVSADGNLNRDVRLEADSTAIGEVVVEGKRTVRSIDKTSYLFTKEQVGKASDGRELVATLPNLRVDRTTNALATIDGKSVLILINGIKATEEELRDMRQHCEGKRLLMVRNKIDLCGEACPKGYLPLCAKQGKGLRELEDALYQAADIPEITENDVIITSVRHYEALIRAHEAISLVIQGMENGLSGDLLSEHLRACLDALADITGGSITPQEVLNNVFKHFCVGK